MPTELPDPIALIGTLGAMALVPFIAIMVTSFVKLAVVLTLVRNALGVQQIPPNAAVYGLAIILTIYIMAPVGLSAFEVLKDKPLDLSDREAFLATIEEAAQPFKEFLKKNVDPAQQDFFKQTTELIWPKEQSDLVTRDS